LQGELDTSVEVKSSELEESRDESKDNLNKERGISNNS